MMRRPPYIVRAIALGLALGLPAVTGARLALDMRTTIETRSHVHAEKPACCTWSHDHRLCVLVYQAPWSPASVAPRIALPLPPLLATPAEREPARDGGEVRLQTARSPPQPA
jgi:hypothetical protein